MKSAYRGLGVLLLVVPPAAPRPRNSQHGVVVSHPTLAGSYLAAYVFLAVLFEESPVGIGFFLIFRAG